jgi:hypothetical protein
MVEQPRPGDQPLPVPAGGPSMHDLVAADVATWAQPQPGREAIRALLAERKQLGLDRYGSLLQSHNGRDARRDLTEECADAAVYARQLLEELAGRPGSAEAYMAYRRVLSALFWAHKIPKTDPIQEETCR